MAVGGVVTAEPNENGCTVGAKSNSDNNPEMLIVKEQPEHCVNEVEDGPVEITDDPSQEDEVSVEGQNVRFEGGPCHSDQHNGCPNSD